ncbi:MAG: hypothetical protein RLN96_04550 [Pseudomonadales bacterium]
MNKTDVFPFLAVIDSCHRLIEMSPDKARAMDGSMVSASNVQVSVHLENPRI